VLDLQLLTSTEKKTISWSEMKENVSSFLPVQFD